MSTGGMLSRSIREKRSNTSLGTLSDTIRTGIFCISIIWSSTPHATVLSDEMSDYAFAINQLGERATDTAELGSLPRVTDPEIENLLQILSDSQTYLFSPGTTFVEKTVICLIATRVVEMYMRGLPDTSTEIKEATSHESIVARTAEYADELILIKPFLTDCLGQMLSMLLKAPASKYKNMKEKSRFGVKSIQQMALTDLIGTLAAANESSLPLDYRLVTLQSMVRNASLLARTVPREERVRIAGMVDEVIEKTEPPVIKELIQIKQQYLSIAGCETACQALR